jgi:hypothetical protein
MNRLSFVPRLMFLQLGAIFLLLSCASTRPPQGITVRVAPGFAGIVQLTPCVAGAGADVTADARGMANTSVCPSGGGNVSVAIVQAERQFTAAAQDVEIRRTGDGIATSIDIRVH